MKTMAIVQRMIRSRCIVLAACCVAGVHGVLAQQFDQVLMQQSTVIFVGTVLQKNAVSFDAVPRSERTAVVRVDRVLDRPPVILLQNGDTVTVMLNDPTSLPEGSRATLYTDGWIVGRGIALKEVGHTVLTPEEAGALDQAGLNYIAAKRQMRDELLRARIARADIVAHGSVVSVRPAEVTKRFITEHDPEWQEAVVRVQTAIKGAAVGEQIVVRFPGSMDVAFARSPKLKPGDEQILVAVKDTLTGLPRAIVAGRPTDAYLIESSADVLPKEELERVQRLSR